VDVGRIKPISMFSFVTIKAVDSELAPDLSSTAFIKASRRFVPIPDRFAKPYSDNGTKFRDAERQLRQMFRAMRNITRDAAMR